MTTIDLAIRTAVTEALRLAKKTELPDPEASALAVIGSISQPVRNHMAFLYVARQVREELRAESVAVGRRAARKRQQRDPQLDADLQAAETNRLAALRAGVAMIVRDYSANLKVEWTAELLQTPFSLGDGAYVIFGEATADEHQQKVEIYMTNVIGNLESAALHIKAIADIERAGSKTLNESLQ